MRKIKVIMFFKKRRFAPDPFVKFGKKRSVYHAFFKEGIQKGFVMYIGSGLDSYKGGMTFNDVLEYNGEYFEKKDSVEADAVYDRSGGLLFPSKEMTGKVLNRIEFKELCADKNLTYDLLGDFMPMSYEIESREKFLEVIKKFSEDKFMVLKPASDFGGKGIVMDRVGKIKKAELRENEKYTLQEFVDTSGGIEGVTDKMHDLRIIIANGEICMAHVRTPKEGSYLANVSLGGSIKEVDLSKIPRNIIETAKKVQEIIDLKYDKPVYSIDLGIENRKPFVFELNDQIGFPDEAMKGGKNFISSILESLKILAA